MQVIGCMLLVVSQAAGLSVQSDQIKKLKAFTAEFAENAHFK